MYISSPKDFFKSSIVISSEDCSFNFEVASATSESLTYFTIFDEPPVKAVLFVADTPEIEVVKLWPVWLMLYLSPFSEAVAASVAETLQPLEI